VGLKRRFFLLKNFINAPSKVKARWIVDEKFGHRSHLGRVGTRQEIQDLFGLLLTNYIKY
jgi:hypothetical protein